MPALDYTDLSVLSQQLMEVTEQLLENASAVGMARQVREFNSDQRKRALALAVRDVLLLKPELSAAAADMQARTLDGYKTSLIKLRDDLRTAEVAIAENDALRAKHDSLRSLLSFQKTLSQNL